MTETARSSIGSPTRVACVGDSITYGMGVANRVQNSYPALLRRYLGPNFQIRNFGVSGTTLLKKGSQPYWNQPQFRAATAYAPQFVVLALGTNDSKPRNWKYKAEFEVDLRSMVEHFRHLPSRPRVWVCLPPPVITPDEDGINEPVVRGEIIPRIRRVAKKLHSPIIDLHLPLSTCPQFFPDGIHPNAAGAKVIAQTVFVALTQNESDSNHAPTAPRSLHPRHLLHSVERGRNPG